MKPMRYLAVAACAVPSVAFAHTGHGIDAGMLHPLLGIDHLLAFLVMGLWAARPQSGGWRVVAVALAAMGLGGALGIAGINLPFVEYGILTSLLVLGLLVAAGVRMPKLGVGLIAGFALLHGHAHGVEMPVVATAAAYVAGFLVATAMIQAAGYWFGRQLLSYPALVRSAGVLVAIGGAVLAVAR